MNVKNSIIPALSNNNHELFHSNLWAWLIEQDNNFMKVFFNDYKESIRIKKVHREKLNIDLLIEDKKGNHYVIENKLKSIAGEDQLNEYHEKVNKKYKNSTNKFLLVFLIKNNSLKVDGWDGIDYIEIVQKMRNVLKQEKKKNEVINYYYNIIKEYCDYTEKVFNVIKKSLYTNSEKYNFNTKDNHLEYPKLKVVYQKLKAEKMKEYLDKKIHLKKWDNEFKNNGLSLVSKLGYNNGKPCLTYRVQRSNWENYDLRNHTAIEIQIEGNQFRYMVRLIKKSKDRGEKTQNRDKYFDKALEIFEKTKFLCGRAIKKNKKIHGKKSSMKSDYCSYDSGKKTIGIYQYNDIAKNESYRKLSKEISEELKKIYSMTKDNINVQNFLNEKEK